MKLSENIWDAMDPIIHPSQQVADILDAPEDYEKSDAKRAYSILQTQAYKSSRDNNIPMDEINEALRLQHDFTLDTAKDKLKSEGLL